MRKVLLLAMCLTSSAAMSQEWGNGLGAVGTNTGFGAGLGETGVGDISEGGCATPAGTAPTLWVAARLESSYNDNDALSTINNSGSNGRTFTNVGNGTYQSPCAWQQVGSGFANGMPCYSLDGVNDYFSDTGSEAAYKYLHDGTGGTVYVVLANDWTQTCGTMGDTSGTSTGTGTTVYANSTAGYSAIVFRSVISTYAVNSSADFSMGRVMLAFVYEEGRSPEWAFRVNGVEWDSGASENDPDTGNSTKPMELGTRGDGSTSECDGEFFEWVFFDEAHTDSQIAEWESYFTCLYGAFPEQDTPDVGSLAVSGTLTVSLNADDLDGDTTYNSAWAQNATIGAASAEWENTGSWGGNFINSTAAERPLLRKQCVTDTHGCVRADGTNDDLYSSLAASGWDGFVDGSSGTCYIVANQDTANGEALETLFATVNTGTGAYFLMSCRDDGAYEERAYHAIAGGSDVLRNTDTGISGTCAPDVFEVHVVSWSTTLMTAYNEGAAIMTDTSAGIGASTSEATASLFAYSGSGSNRADADIYAIYCWDAEHDSTEVATVVAELERALNATFPVTP